MRQPQVVEGFRRHALRRSVENHDQRQEQADAWRWSESTMV